MWQGAGEVRGHRPVLALEDIEWSVSHAAVGQSRGLTARGAQHGDVVQGLFEGSSTKEIYSKSKMLAEVCFRV